MIRRSRAVVFVLLLALVAAACGGDDDETSTSGDGGGSSGGAACAVEGATGAGTGGSAVGFIFVGPKDDFGYNQAAYDGAMAVKEACSDFEVLTAENVPEADTAAQFMEDMIDKGAKLIFATSYGHLDPALKVAEEHPDVVIVQQGNVISGAAPANAGTYFGTVYEPVYLAGIAAGKATESNKLGYVYAFPIPQTLANINAFQLGAQSVNPDVETITVSTSSWCDPAAQAEAANSLIGQDVDVITQHQDCQATVIKAAETAGISVVGYHADAQELAPKGWLTGSEWNWGPLYLDIVKTVASGEFTGSKYNGNYRVGYKDGANPFVQSEFGPSVDEATKTLVAEALEKIKMPEGSPFAGPVVGQDGDEIIAAGEVPGYDEVETIFATTFVEGVVGDIPKG
jgi:simple sugar transport system substrate-binding protein/basic membrane protein A